MVGEKIRKLRESQGYTQSSLGDILNLSPSTIGMYEQGRRLPDIETLVRMCQILFHKKRREWKSSLCIQKTECRSLVCENDIDCIGTIYSF